MKNYLTVVVIVNCLLLTACVSAPSTKIAITNEQITEYIKYKELEKVTDKLTGDYCVDAANYGRAMSFLTSAGIPMNTLDDYTINPKVVNFPVRTIQFFVASHKGNPGQVYDDVYQLCLKSGWVNLVAGLKNKTPPPISDLKLTRSLSTVPHLRK